MAKNKYPYRYKHIPTGLEYKFRIKKITGISVIYEDACGTEIWRGFLEYSGVKDWVKMENLEAMEPKSNIN